MTDGLCNRNKPNAALLDELVNPFDLGARPRALKKFHFGNDRNSAVGLRLDEARRCAIFSAWPERTASMAAPMPPAVIRIRMRTANA